MSRFVKWVFYTLFCVNILYTVVATYPVAVTCYHCDEVMFEDPFLARVVEKWEENFGHAECYLYKKQRAQYHNRMRDSNSNEYKNFYLGENNPCQT